VQMKAMTAGSAFAHTSHHQHGPVNSGNTSIGSGNNVDTPISVLVNICGTAIAILGFRRRQLRGRGQRLLQRLRQLNTFSSTPVFP
jgi:hypothetical protein